MNTTAHEQAVWFDHVSLRVPGGRTILDDIDLRIPRGATTALLGRSGSGKTTLLRMVNRLLEPSAGRVVVEGRATTAWDPIALRRSIGYVVQETGLFPHWSAERNMGAVPEISGISREEVAGRVQRLFALVGLDYASLGRRLPHQLSGGQRQRVGVARALAAEPKLLLMDEPFGALDPITRAEMQDMLLNVLCSLKKTVLLVTHDLDEALYLSSYIVLLEDGRIAARLPAKDFLQAKIPVVENYVRAVRRQAKTASGAVS